MSINDAVIKQLNMSEEDMVAFLVNDMKKIFSDMAGIDNVNKNPALIDPVNVFSDYVTALVGLAGEYSGLVALHLPDILAIDFTSKMLGHPVEEVNRDVHDAIGELVTMIAGSFKYHLGNSGNKISLSTPSIFIGREYFFTNSAPEESLAILCDVGDQWFMLSLTLKLH